MSPCFNVQKALYFSHTACAAALLFTLCLKPENTFGLFIVANLFFPRLFFRISSSCSMKVWRWWSSSTEPPSMSTCSFSCSTRNFTGNRKRIKGLRTLIQTTRPALRVAESPDLNHPASYTFPSALVSCALCKCMCIVLYYVDHQMCFILNRIASRPQKLAGVFFLTVFLSVTAYRSEV